MNWEHVISQFLKSEEVVNLNFGGISPAPKATIEAVNRLSLKLSEAPSYHTWQTFEEQKKEVRRSLASILGCDVTEIAITRNATEALSTIIFGLRLEKNDEVVLSKYDYPAVINAWEQRELRDGVKLVWVDLQLPSEDEQCLVDAYVSKFTGKTRFVFLTHVINWNGQIMPVAKISQIAAANGIEAIIDGSQSFALLDYKIGDLNCSYFATSLHKWLNGPTGTGMLFIKKDRICNVFPLFGNKNPLGNDIRKFEGFGIRNIAVELGIGHSVNFHHSIGVANKRRRLFDLKNRWMTALESAPGIRHFTSFDPEWSCAIGTVALEGYSSAELVRKLFDNWKIHVASANKEQINGIRVTPGISSTEADIDGFIAAMLELSASDRRR